MAATADPAVVDLTIYQGSEFEQEFIWQEDGVEVSLLGWTARMHIRAAHTTGITQSQAVNTLLCELATSNGRIVLNTTPGSIILRLTASETAAIAAVPAKYDIELTNGSGQTYRFAMGQVIVSPEVTLG